MLRLTIHEGKIHSTLPVHGVDRDKYNFKQQKLTGRRLAKEFQRVLSQANWCSVNTINEIWLWKK